MVAPREADGLGDMDSSRPWYVITGGPSSGKSTTIRLLADRGYRVVQEQARVIIREQMALGRALEDIRGEGEAFQVQILERQLAAESACDPKEIVFLDRGIPDGLAYERFLDLNPNPDITVAAHAARYRRIFVLDPLHLHDDGSRIEDDVDQQRIHDAIVATYRELGADIVSVPVMDSRERVDFILERIDHAHL